MKKITLLLFMMLVSLCGYAQGLENESFEGVFPPPGWTIYQNDVSANDVTWVKGPVGSSFIPPHTGAVAAYLDKENVQVGIPEDWMITKPFTVPVNAQVHFWSKLTQGNDQGSRYDVRIAATQADMIAGNYTSLVDSDGWGEAEMNPINQLLYTEKVLNIPSAYTGQTVCIAFYMKGLNGDRWIVDDVSVAQLCNKPTLPTATNPQLYTADLKWVSTATTWEIEVVLQGGTPTGTGIIYSGPMPYQPVLQPGTPYKYYVRAVCSPTNKSEWAGPVSFTTIALGATCAAPKVIPALPYSTTDSTAGYGDDIEGVPGAAAGCGTSGTFLNGYEVVYSYTASFTGDIVVSMTGNGANSGMFIYTSCANIGVSCAAGGTGNATTPVNIPSFAVTQGQTYYIVIATSGTTLTTPYTLTIQRAGCAAPGTLAAIPTMNAAQLSWTNPSGATSWEVDIQPVGSPIPAGSGNYTAGTNTNFLAENLASATTYQYYVRADCGNGTFSAWSGPFRFSTTICEPIDQCNYKIVMTDSFGGWEGGRMEVRQNGILVATVGANFTGTGPLEVAVPLCHDVPFELFWTVAGSFPDEVGVAIKNKFDQVVYAKPIGEGSPGSLFSGMTDCLVPLCIAPTALTATNPTQSSIQLGWSGPGTGAWDYYVVPAGSAPPTAATPGVYTTTNPTIVSGLEIGTGYDFYVRIVCADPTAGPWAGPLSFNTTQIPATLTYTMDFEGASSGWGFTNGQQVNRWTVGSAANNGGSKSMYISNNNGTANAYNVAAASVVQAYRDIQIPAATAEIGLDFDWRSQGQGPTNDYFRVWMVPVDFMPVPGTQITAGAGRVQVPGTFNLKGDWTHGSYVINTATYGGLVRRLVFEWRNDATVGTQPPAAIDNINVKVITCRVPTALAVPVATIAPTQAVVNWTAPTGASVGSYDYYLSTSATPPYEYTVPTNNVTGPGMTLTGIESSTTYYLWVRSNCGDPNGASYWVGPVSFTTLQIPAILPYIQDFEEPNSRFTYVNGTQTNKWLLGTATDNGGAQSIYVSNDNGASNAYTSVASTTHTYRDLAIPLGATEIEVKFDWKALGETNAATPLDYLRVWMVAPNFTPTAGTLITAAAGTRVLLTPALNQNGDWLNASYSTDATTYANQTRRLVFEWRNDAVAANQPPAAIDNLEVSVVTCRKPTALAVDPLSVTQTGAQLSWTEMNLSTDWQVVVVPSGSPMPNDATVGTTVPGILPTYEATGLNPGTVYVFYVRTNCGGALGSSVWAGPFQFVTKISNDECANAITVPVNNGVNCLLDVPGTIIGATASAEPNTCAGNDNDDVWFQFTAGAQGELPGALSTHEISLNNVIGSTTDLNFTVYTGNDCATMSQFYCSLDNTAYIPGFIAGTTYKIRVYSAGAAAATTTFDVCITSPPGPIIVSQNQYTITQLVKDIFINNDCVDVQNIQSGTGPGAANNGIAYFNQGDSTFGKDNWPEGNELDILNGFENGIVLVSGSAADAAGPNDVILSNGGGWDLPAEDQLAQLVSLPTADVHDSSWIAFDFVPLGSEMRFDYIFASEEYDGAGFECTYSDVFAFILTDLNTGVVTNLAVLPGTDTPILVTNIHPDSGCPAVNEQYFQQYNNTNYDPINFQGMTKNLRAKSPVIQGHVYNLKMIVANARDHQLNSAVFLKGNSFYTGAPELGEDMLVADGNGVCDGETVTLNSELNPVDYSFIWTRGTEILYDEIGPTLVVDQPGTYTLESAYIGSLCSEETSITIEFYPAVNSVTTPAPDLTACNASGFSSFNLTAQTATILTGLNAAGYAVSYHLTLDDAKTGDGDLALTYTNVTPFLQTIFVRIQNVATGCFATESFDLIIQDLTPQFTIENDFSICQGTSGTISVVAGNFDPAATTVSYTWTHNGGPFAGTGSSVTVTDAGLYEVTVNNSGCAASKSVNVTTTPYPVADDPADVQACGSYILPILTSGNYYTATGGTGTPLAAGSPVTSTQTIYVYAANGTGTVCADENSFEVTIFAIPAVTNPGPQVACNSYVLPALATGNYFTASGGAGTMLTAGQSITADQTIYIYAQSGTMPNCTAEVSFTVTITPVPAIPDPADVAACNTYTLPALSAGTYYTGAGGTGTTVSAGTQLTETQTLYVYYFGGAACTVDNAFTVTVTKTPIITIEHGCDGSNYVLEVKFDGDTFFNEDNVDIVWEDSAGNEIGYESSVVVTQSGTYFAHVTAAGATTCGAVEDVDVTSTACSMQKGISPNGDDKNDTFDLTAMDVNKISIFNRYGTEVFSYGKYTNQWHGQGKGDEELPTGTYFYTFERANGDNITGWIYINREEN